MPTDLSHLPPYILAKIGTPVEKGTTAGSTWTSDGVVLGPVNGTWQILPELSRAQFYALLDPFIKLLETERNGIAAGMRRYEHIGYDEGDRFVKVWRSDTLPISSRSVSYFVEKRTGIIFGAKGWKAFNPNNEYGTLHTINEWDWSDYYGVSKKGLKTLTPKWCRRK